MFGGELGHNMSCDLVRKREQGRFQEMSITPKMRRR